MIEKNHICDVGRDDDGYDDSGDDHASSDDRCCDVTDY